VTVDGNEATASVAHRTNEVIAIYPITPASPMGELCDEWSAAGRKNLWGTVPDVVQLQSEGGAAGACHGALQAGALTTTFTASQGLLLMIPNMYKIAGELTPFCLHVAARTLATHALSIFGDHSDVMAVRQTGFALLASGSVQEAQDLAAVAQAATLRSRVPFLHFFDGFRTSHEIARIERLSDDDLRELLDEEAVTAHRARALNPDRPVIRGTAQNPDVFFQAREAVNPFYEDCPRIVRETMEQLAALTGRRYDLFDYAGHPQAERVIVLMGSGAETVHETVDRLVAQGERVGVVKVRLCRPFAVQAFLEALPSTAKAIAVLDRTKEPGSVGEPLWQDVVSALIETERRPTVIGGRYGLSSKEFDPAMVRAVFAELGREQPKRRFTVGIKDDVSHLSLAVDGDAEADGSGDDEPGVHSAVFYGLGSDGTVGANKNTIKILGDATDFFVQGYFVYDSKKAGAVTVSHLRFGPRPIRSAYLVKRAGFVACHQWDFLDRFDVLDRAADGAALLLNAPGPAGEVWDKLPREMQETIVSKRLRPWVIDAYAVAREAGLGVRINTIMQTCYFAISGVLPKDAAMEHIKQAIRDTYSKRGSVVVKQNCDAVDRTLANLHELTVPDRVTSTRPRPPIVSPEAPDFVQRVTAIMLANQGDLLPVSAFPPDGTWPAGTTRWEKRNLAAEIPVWDEALCIQCNRCALACPHAAIRAKTYDAAALAGAPPGFQSTAVRGDGAGGALYTLQVAPEDCTGCGVCVEVCPAKDKANPRHKAIDMAPQRPLREREREKYGFFLGLPEPDRTQFAKMDTKESQLLEPLFEYSGACAGCGETPYLKLLSQLFGDRLLVANATGCSSIYGGNLPTTPWTVNREGRGPAWANSLFEDNAEFGFGIRLALDVKREHAEALLRELGGRLGDTLVGGILGADQSTEAGIQAQRSRVAELQQRLAELGADPVARRLSLFADAFVKKSVWIVGGDGWAYDIGYGGLDHVLCQHRDVNILVLDTEVYSNTGGQQSKATPMGAAAKFAASGKDAAKKDLGLEAMSYGHAFVARIAFGANMNQTVHALREADSFHGPSLVIAYSHCIAHGYDMRNGPQQQQLAVQSGMWPLFRFDPRRVRQGEPPLHLDSRKPTIPIRRYMENEARFRMVEKSDPERYERLAGTSQRQADQRFAVYQQLAEVRIPVETEHNGDGGGGSHEGGGSGHEGGGSHADGRPPRDR
jgi:pyruvate-ferredoxin/flavodoxin oxidoreductase